MQQLAANGGQFMNSQNGSNMYQSSYVTNGNGTSNTNNGNSFTNLTPASVLHHQGLSSHISSNGAVGNPPPAHLSNFKHNKNLLHSRKHSLKNVDKGTEEYRRRRERNNIAVRKSREKAKVRSREVEEKVKNLIKEKDVLIRRLEEMTNEIQLHKQLYMHLMNHSNPEINQICRSALNLVNMSNGDHGM
jgi:CCAAT/enhancer binding protein (C/EBP)